jgi:hypothetical protein
MRILRVLQGELELYLAYGIDCVSAAAGLAAIRTSSYFIGRNCLGLL